MTEATALDTSAEIVRATPQARLLLSLLLLLTLIFFLVCQFVAIPFLIKTLNTNPLPPASIVTIKSMLAVFGSISMMTGAGTIFYGRAIGRENRYPPARAWVWRDTLIKRGKIAIRFAWLHIAIGTLICIIGLGCSLYLWRLVDKAMPYSSTNKHFIILKQETIIPPAPARSGKHSASAQP